MGRSRDRRNKEWPPQAGSRNNKIPLYPSLPSLYASPFHGSQDASGRCRRLVLYDGGPHSTSIIPFNRVLFNNRIRWFLCTPSHILSALRLLTLSQEQGSFELHARPPIAFPLYTAGGRRSATSSVSHVLVPDRNPRTRS